MYKTEINAAISLISGHSISGIYHWASTQYNNISAWVIKWETGEIKGYNKAQTVSVRAFQKISQ